jgi:AraC-like DNA-binding protein
VATLSGKVPTAGDPPPRDRQRISDAVRHIEESAGEPLGLGDLSTFNARFREIIGLTPQAFRKG